MKGLTSRLFADWSNKEEIAKVALLVALHTLRELDSYNKNKNA
jgi:hypothetical protein